MEARNFATSAILQQPRPRPAHVFSAEKLFHVRNVRHQKLILMLQHANVFVLQV